MYISPGKEFLQRLAQCEQTAEVSLSAGRPVAEGILTWWPDSPAFVEGTDHVTVVTADT